MKQFMYFEKVMAATDLMTGTPGAVALSIIDYQDLLTTTLDDKAWTIPRKDSYAEGTHRGASDIFLKKIRFKMRVYFHGETLSTTDASLFVGLKYTTTIYLVGSKEWDDTKYKLDPFTHETIDMNKDQCSNFLELKLPHDRSYVVVKKWTKDYTVSSTIVQDDDTNRSFQAGFCIDYTLKINSKYRFIESELNDVWTVTGMDGYRYFLVFSSHQTSIGANNHVINVALPCARFSARFYYREM